MTIHNFKKTFVKLGFSYRRNQAMYKMVIDIAVASILFASLYGGGMLGDVIYNEASGTMKAQIEQIEARFAFMFILLWVVGRINKA